ncbi:EsaB/YukD family protein [Baekduia sp. Peel2402]|uniref:EsaB/YukD family protein n=1 Tax=Baekduia sp. Peel2402 TaxID=3458296 RepID=UPI00403EEB21
MMTAQMLRITCHEKGRPDSFEADVADDCTVDEIVAGLIEAEYLTGPTPTDRYTLVNGRTGEALPADGTLLAAGVRDGDVLTVTKTHHGA